MASGWRILLERPLLTLLDFCHALLDNDDVDQMFEALEGVSVARVEGKLGRERRRCDEQVDRSLSPRLSSCSHDGSEDAAVGACSVGIER